MIYLNGNNSFLNLQDLINIKKFCNKNHIKFYISDNVRLAIKVGADGIYLTKNYNKMSHNFTYKKGFAILGSVHNQLEYYKKITQGCEKIFLSPIFYNKKYSVNKILNPIKFNLISLDWKVDLCALGGLAEENIGKIKMTKAQIIGIKSLVNKR